MPAEANYYRFVHELRTLKMRVTRALKLRLSKVILFFQQAEILQEN